MLNPVQRSQHGRRGGFPAYGLGRTRESFGLIKRQFNQCKNGQVGRQEQNMGTAFFQQFGQAYDLTEARVIEHDHSSS